MAALYMREHLIHHRLVGTDDDPDITNYRDYPISRARLWRKLKRDITGQTGARDLYRKLIGFSRLTSLDSENRAALLRGLILASRVCLLSYLLSLCLICS